MDNVEKGESAAPRPPAPATVSDSKSGGGGDVPAAAATSETDVVKKGGDGDGSGEEKDAKKEKAKSIGTAKLLFKYATPLEILYMFLGTASAVVCGLTVPYFIIVFGDIMDELNGDDIFDAVSSLSGVFAATGAVAFVSGFFMVAFWNTCCGISRRRGR